MTVGVPDTLEALLKPEWLTRALAPRFPGIEVATVRLGPIVSRISTNARFRIECVGGMPEGLVPDLCAKGYFSDHGGADYRYLGEAEACFYRDLAAPSRIRTLRAVYAEVDPGTRHGVVISEDVVAQGATVLDSLSAYGPDQTAASLEELAKLHASTWGHRADLEVDWLAPRLGSYTAFRGVADIQFNFEREIGAGVPASVRDPQRVFDAFQALVALTAADADRVVTHGDPHVGNLFLDARGRPAFVDWQMVQRGPWYLDVGYHLASTLSVDDRRASERDLVRHYLAALKSAGVETPVWDAAWRGVRLGIVLGLYLWAITRRVDPPITTELLTRLGTAADDHDALEEVRR